jgi:hypothetical protein
MNDRNVPIAASYDALSSVSFGEIAWLFWGFFNFVFSRIPLQQLPKKQTPKLHRSGSLVCPQRTLVAWKREATLAKSGRSSRI